MPPSLNTKYFINWNNLKIAHCENRRYLGLLAVWTSRKNFMSMFQWTNKNESNMAPINCSLWIYQCECRMSKNKRHVMFWNWTYISEYDSTTTYQLWLTREGKFSCQKELVGDIPRTVRYVITKSFVNYFGSQFKWGSTTSGPLNMRFYGLSIINIEDFTCIIDAD